MMYLIRTVFISIARSPLTLAINLCASFFLCMEGLGYLRFAHDHGVIQIGIYHDI